MACNASENRSAMSRMGIPAVRLWAAVCAFALTTPAMAGGEGGDDLAQRTQQARALLRAELGTDATITTVSAQSMTWRDGALGCPEPGMVYTQARVDGYRIVLEAEGREYAYHGRSGREPVYCADPARE